MVKSENGKIQFHLMLLPRQQNTTTDVGSMLDYTCVSDRNKGNRNSESEQSSVDHKKTIYTFTSLTKKKQTTTLAAQSAAPELRVRAVLISVLTLVAGLIGRTEAGFFFFLTLR